MVGYEPDNRKHETHVRRAKERIDKSREINSLRTTFAPLLCRLTLLAVIEKINIPFLVCEFEADHDIATLANLFLCPVLSDDSDFFVYDLRTGYLPLKTLIISKNCCKGKLYNVKNMKKVFPGMQIPKLPILAVTFGSDYIKREYLYKIYSSLSDDFSKSNLTVVQRKAIIWSITVSLGYATSRLEEVLPETFVNLLRCH